MRVPVCPVELGGKVIRDPAVLRVKIANAPASEKGYEATLAKLGLTVLQDRVADLMPYFRGFQLLELSDDGEFAAGFFVFEANDLVMDAPMFMIKGRMKGKELLFLRDRQMFVPSQEGLIQYLLGSRDQTLGLTGPSDFESRNNRSSPNIDVFSRANQFMRKVSHIPFSTPWGREAKVFDSYLSTYLHSKTASILESLSKTKRLPPAPLEKLLVIDGMAEKLAGWCQVSPLLEKRVVARLGKDWQTKVAQSRKEAESWRKPITTLRRPSVFPMLSKVAASPIPRVGVLTHVPEFLTGSDREAAVQEIAEFGCFIADTRTPGMTKTAMVVQDEDKTFSGVVESGVVEVPLRDGEKRKCLVFVAKNRVQTSYSPSRETLVISANGDGAVECVSSDLVAQISNSHEPVAAIESWKESLKEVGELKIPANDVFVLIDPYGNCAGPLRSEGSGESGELDVCSAHIKRSGRAPRDGNSVSMSSHGGMAKTCSSRVRRLRVTDRVKTFSYIDTDDDVTLLVPKNARMFKLKLEKDPYSDCGHVASIPILPLSQMSEDLMDKTASFAMSMPSDSVVRLNGAILPVKTAAMQLIKEYGLSKAAVLDTFRQSRESGRVVKYAAIPSGAKLAYWQLFTVKAKTADMSPPDRPPYQFDFPAEVYGQSDSTIPVLEKYPTETAERSQIQYADENDPNWSGYLAPYEKPRETRGISDGQRASQVAKANESLWENTLFSSLLRNVRAESQIAQQVRMMFQECDMFGRSLFLIYGHQEQFEDLFGEKDLPEIEEQLLTLFEGNGELIADLLRRNISAVGDGIEMAMESA